MATAPGPLGEFLRAQRARITPADVGLPDVGARRVCGLRREEVAVLAGVSADYYARLEQGRERTPSAQVVDALCTALRLSPDAREHTFRLAKLASAAQPEAGPVSPELLQLMDAFPHAAAYVVDPGFQILAANTTAKALLGPVQLALGAFDFLFVDPAARSYFEHWDQVARSAVSALRLAAGFASPHPAVPPLVSRLLAGSSEFAAFWADQTVAGLSLTEKVINHPDVGRITLTYQTLDVREAPGQQLTVATAPAGSASADALALLGTLEATRTMRP
ncbi:helix-turn-helix transcriptional regulator [Promicromonospora thailandica]|uniref:Helix-turn-helix domain-containing protein n=1 Tax=Promicromonospora thailandica TaxID=765201 RepID=A0A9X2JWG5_9MICO|nr:helix-turn-helix transcriptional regulator [Promicromonospora thailandica]MCP2265517.1 Helix-turn-helix domain-containing protein [Promicromonospora thailandica]